MLALDHRSPAQAPDPRGRGHRLTSWLGYAIAVAALVWVFHDVAIADVWKSMRQMAWGWVLPAVMLDVISYICQGWRWRLLIRPFARLAVARTTQAIYAGLFVNELLPARLGELVRAYLVHRWTGVGVPRVFTTMLVERLFDGIWLAIGIGLTAIWVPLPRDFILAGDILGAIVLLGTAVVLILMGRSRRAPQAGTDASTGTSAHAEGNLWRRLVNSLEAIAGSTDLVNAFAISSLILVFQGAALWMLMLGFHLHLGLAAGIAVFLIVHLGTMLPNAPGNIGTYQLFCVLALGLFGIPKPTATGFSVMAFLILTIPLWVIGAIAVARSGLGFTPRLWSRGLSK